MLEGEEVVERVLVVGHVGEQALGAGTALAAIVVELCRARDYAEAVGGLPPSGGAMRGFLAARAVLVSA